MVGVAAAGTPVIRLAAGSAVITSAPSWPNPSTSAVAGTPIHYNASNQLFGFSSSKRYKTNIRNMSDNESEIIYKLNPVTYDAKEGHGEGKDIPGFIAEEIYETAPNLAILNNENQPENIAYNSLHALVIKEIQKHQQQLKKLKTITYERALIINNLVGLILKGEQIIVDDINNMK